MAMEQPRDEGEYDVERIDGERLAPGVHEYWIKWAGYDELDWIPSADCFCPDLIKDLRAVQDANLVAARLAGRVHEIRMLVTIGDNAKGRAKGKAKARTGLLSRRKSRNRRSDLLQRKRAESIPDSTKSSECFDSELDEEIGMHRNARANTARLRLGSVDGRKHGSDAGYIVWYRSMPIDLDAVDAAGQLAISKANDEKIQAWRKDLDIENDEVGRTRIGDAEEEERRQRKEDIEALEAQDADFREGAEKLAQIIIHKNAERRAVELQVLRIRRLEKIVTTKSLRERSTNTTALRRSRSRTIIKDEQTEEHAKRQRLQRVNMQRVLDNASAAKIPLLRCPGGQQKAAIHPPVLSASEKALKAAREEEARIRTITKSNQVRHEFLNSTSVKRVEQLISETKAAPERVFTRSSVSDIPRPTIET